MIARAALQRLATRFRTNTKCFNRHCFVTSKMSFCNQSQEKIAAFAVEDVDVSDYHHAYDHCDNLAMKLITPQSIMYGKKYQARKNDIFLVTPPKSGTIWTGYVVFLLKCKCDPAAIEKICENEDFIPFMYACYDYDFLINNDDWKQNPDIPPRLMMKHGSVEESYVDLSNGSHTNCNINFGESNYNGNGKVITVMRDPCDAVYSLYRMLNDDYPRDTPLNFDGFAETYAFRNGKEEHPQGLVPLLYFQSWARWYAYNGFQYKYNNVLTLFFDDLIENRLACIREIEKFLDINNPDDNNNYDKELENEILRLTSFEEMKKIGTKLRFGRIGRYFAKRELGLTDEEIERTVLVTNHLRSDGHTIGQGRKNIPQKWINYCDTFWKENVQPVTACHNYQQFREKISFLCTKQ